MPIIKSSPKRPTNISLPLDVYMDAKSLGINLSQTCERFLREAIRTEKSRLWAAQHSHFIEAYNASVDAEGLPLSQWRSF